jgi:hypothetical protein
MHFLVYGVRINPCAFSQVLYGGQATVKHSHSFEDFIDITKERLLFRQYDLASRD